MSRLSILVLGASKQALAAFSNPREALKMVFDVRSIRVFSKFWLDPYYELLLWFMINAKKHLGYKNMQGQSEVAIKQV